MMLRGTCVVAAFVCSILFVVPGSVFAASSDSFTLTQAVNTPDFEAPTTPTNFTATPISTSQIDLDWDPSSDNIFVQGYQVFRDAVQIATTSLTSYSDTGLTASTTYTYFVTAFDVPLNISTSTASISTTTLQIPPPPPEVIGSTTESTRVGGIKILDLSYDTTEHSIDLRFITNYYTRANIRWGRTGSFEGGFSASDVFRKEHKTTIDGLDAGTVYEIEIYLVDNRLLREYRQTIRIVTDLGPDVYPPVNVSDFVATVHNNVVDLSWLNPNISDFSKVRVLSSDHFYPTHFADGWLVYEGAGEFTQDERHLSEGQRRFYTIFVYDTSDNISSGVITSVMRLYADGSSPGPSDDRYSSSTDSELGEPSFSFDDIIFVQDGVERPSVGGEVVLTAHSDTTIQLPYEMVPENLKTIVVTLKHPTDSKRVFSFLLRINRDKSAYEAIIGPLEDGGVYPFTTEVFDFATKKIQNVEGTVVVDDSFVTKVMKDTKRGIGSFIHAQKARGWILVGIVLLLIILFFLRRRNRDEDSSL